jgi:hypothetical protein
MLYVPLHHSMRYSLGSVAEETTDIIADLRTQIDAAVAPLYLTPSYIGFTNPDSLRDALVAAFSGLAVNYNANAGRWFVGGNPSQNASAPGLPIENIPATATRDQARMIVAMRMALRFAQLGPLPIDGVTAFRDYTLSQSVEAPPSTDFRDAGVYRVLFVPPGFDTVARVMKDGYAGWGHRITAGRTPAIVPIHFPFTWKSEAPMGFGRKDHQFRLDLLLYYNALQVSDVRTKEVRDAQTAAVASENLRVQADLLRKSEEDAAEIERLKTLVANATVTASDLKQVQAELQIREEEKARADRAIAQAKEMDRARQTLSGFNALGGGLSLPVVASVGAAMLVAVLYAARRNRS